MNFLEVVGLLTTISVNIILLYVVIITVILKPVDKCPNDHKTMVKHNTKICNICGIDL